MAYQSQERILKRIHELYEKGLNPGGEGSVGLLQIAHDPLLQVTCWKPRKKVNVMIIGNHSAGKSSFINWYIGESVQTTGVAIETRGFTYVTSGRKRETLKGDATFAFYDHIDGLQKFKAGLQDKSAHLLLRCALYFFFRANAARTRVLARYCRYPINLKIAPHPPILPYTSTHAPLCEFHVHPSPHSSQCRQPPFQLPF